MFNSQDPNYSVKTVSFAGTLADADNIKLSIATDTSAASYTGTDLDGASGGVFPISRTVTITTTANPGSYNVTDAIVFTGTDVNGKTITESFTLTQDGGGETLVGSTGFLTVTSIDVPAQQDASGTFVFGVQDVVVTFLCREIRVATQGNLKVSYADGSVDIIPSVFDGEKLPYSPVKVWGDSDTTAQNITLAY